MALQSVRAFFAWMRHCFDLALANGVFRRSTIVSIIVGTILTCINQGEMLLKGEVPLWWKVLLTYLVPFLVSAYGALSSILAAESLVDSANTLPLLARYDSKDTKSIIEDVADSFRCETPRVTKSKSHKTTKDSIFDVSNASKV